MHARAVHRAEQLEAEVDQLRGENRKLKDQLFGRKSEKPSSSDRSNHLDDEQEDRSGSMPRKRGQRNDRPGPPRRDYSHLPICFYTALPYNMSMSLLCLPTMHASKGVIANWSRNTWLRLSGLQLD